MIGSVGLIARACSTTCPPSNASGMATSRRARAGAGWRPRSPRRSAALPCITSSPAARACAASGRFSSISSIGRPCALRPLADQAADPAVADQHDVIGELRSAGSARARPARRRPSGRPRDAAALPRARYRSSRANSTGLSRIERMAPARIRSRPCSRQQGEADAEPGEDEGELADLGEAGRDGQRGATSDGRTARTISEGGERLADHDDQHASPAAASGSRTHDRGIEQHADRDEEQHGEGVAQRQRLLRRRAG